MKPHHQFGLRVHEGLITGTRDGVTMSGEEHVTGQPRTLYVSNHADMFAEGLLVNRALWQHGEPLATLILGLNLRDNLLIRSLISLQPINLISRQKRDGDAAAHIIEELLENGAVWVAQNSGISKTGDHRTHPAMLAKYAKAHRTTIDEYLRDTTVVPVAVSSEYDPIAPYMARILVTGKKPRNADFARIARGLLLPKGRTHVAFAPPLTGPFANGREVAHTLTRTINAHYRAFDSNRTAYAERVYTAGSFNDWMDAPVNTSMLMGNQHLYWQVTNAAEHIRPAIVTRYAYPEMNRLRAISKVSEERLG